MSTILLVSINKMKNRINKKFVFLLIVLTLFYFVLPLIISQSEDVKKTAEDELKKMTDPNYNPENFLKIDNQVQSYLLANNFDRVYNVLRELRKAEIQKIYNQNKNSFIQGLKSISDSKKVSLLISKDNQGYHFFDGTSRKEIIGELASSFKKIDDREKAEIFLEKDSKGRKILEDDFKNELWKALGKDGQEKTFTSIFNKAYSDIYGKIDSIKDKPQLKRISISNGETLKWSGNKVIGEKGAIIDFDAGRDVNSPESKTHDEKSIHPGIEG